MATENGNTADQPLTREDATRVGLEVLTAVEALARGDGRLSVAMLSGSGSPMVAHLTWALSLIDDLLTTLDNCGLPRAEVLAELRRRYVGGP